MCDQCQEGYIGEDCDQCAQGYYKTGKICVPGECSSIGTSKQLADGTCQCRNGFGGNTCDNCKSGFYFHADSCLSKWLMPLGP